jgi:ribokinase
MSVFVLGSTNMDLVVRGTRWPALGETTSGDTFQLVPGGKGANQAVAAARLGAPTAFIGRVGADPYGAQLRAGLDADGVDVSALTDDPDLTSGVAIIFVDDDGQNRIVVVAGANAAVGASEVQRLRERLAPGDVVLLQLEVPMDAVLAAVAAAGEAGATVLLDPAPVPPDGLPAAAFAPHVVLTPNEVEIEALVGFGVPDDEAVGRAARALTERGAGGVVVKLGARGLACSDGGACRHALAPVVRAVDTVGAGDAVNGALAAELAAGRTVSAALPFAAAAASLSVTRAGAQPSMPRRDEVVVGSPTVAA